MANNMIIYTTADGLTKVETTFDQDTVWLTREQMATLFQRDRSVISRHIQKVFSEGELDEKSNVQKMHVPNSDKPVVFYNLDVIISVGYRVKSKRGVEFRRWASVICINVCVEAQAVSSYNKNTNNHIFRRNIHAHI